MSEGDPARPDEGGNVALRDQALTALLVLETLVLFVAAPLAVMGLEPPLLVAGPVAVLLIATIVIVSPNAGARILALFAAVLAICGAVIRIRHPSQLTFWLGHTSVIVAVIAISLVVTRAVFAPGRVTHHRIQGAVVLYLNIAVIFASAYRLLSELSPGSFSNLAAGQSEAAAASSMLYFSLTTLTSTGFGDILPVHPIARSMTNLEAVMGQLYLTILLARLVTMHLDTRRQ
jgi:Ion channel